VNECKGQSSACRDFESFVLVLACAPFGLCLHSCIAREGSPHGLGASGAGALLASPQTSRPSLNLSGSTTPPQQPASRLPARSQRSQTSPYPRSHAALLTGSQSMHTTAQNRLQSALHLPLRSCFFDSCLFSLQSQAQTPPPRSLCSRHRHSTVYDRLRPLPLSPRAHPGASDAPRTRASRSSPPIPPSTSTSPIPRSHTRSPLGTKHEQ
jgi:hypothetical protein